MTGSGVRSGGFIPKLSILEVSRSIRRSLISSEDSPLSARKASTPTELPVLSSSGGTKSTNTKPLLSSRSKIAGDGHGFQWSSTVTWCACFLFVTLVVAVVLGSHHFSNEWNITPLSCPNTPSSSSSPHDDEEQSLLPYVAHQTQDGRFGEEDDKGGEQEDQKCWSRTRHWKYRPSERRFPPSASLARALEKYESLHARCTAGKKWESLTELTRSKNGDDSCKYLVYTEGWEGLGNRFMSLVTAFAYALVTDRVMLLDARRNMSGLVCEPFQRSSWNLPETFPFEKLDELPSLADIMNQEVERVAAVRLNLRHLQSDQDQRFFCADVQERLGNVALIGWESNQYYVPRLYAIPHFWEKLNRLFDDPSLVFTQLSRILLLPQNAVWVKIERIYRAYLATSHKLVGIQVRAPRFNSYDRKIFERMVHCLRDDDHIVPKISQKPLALDKGFNLEEGTAIFVSSLQREYYEQLKEEYADRGAEDGTLVTVHTMAAEGQESSKYAHSVKAFTDMWLLSFSDSLATSGWSTFGYVAQGIGAVYPRIVNTDPAQDESCDQGQSIDPCTHYPFLSSCPGTRISNSSEHGKWIKKHVRPCQDHHLGIQLVHS